MALTAEQRIKQGTWEPAAPIDWASFDPNQWWQTPGLDPSWFHEFGAAGGTGKSWGLAPPPGSIARDWLSLENPLPPGHTFGEMNPLEFYESWGDLSPEWQAKFSEQWGLTPGGAEEPPSMPMWGPFDPIEIPGIPEEDLARFQQWIDEVSGMYEARLEPDFSIWDPELMGRIQERAAPEYTAFSPEQRGAFAENIGGQLALAKRGITETMSQRGIRGSGLEAQLGMTAAGQAARGMGDIRAALASSDEATRTAALDRLTQMQAADEASRLWATQGLEGVRQFGLTGLQGQTADMQRILLDFARMTGMPVMLGPDQQLIDPLGLAEMGMSRDDYLNMMLGNFLKAQEGPTFPEAWGAGEGIDDLIARWIASMRGMAA